MKKQFILYLLFIFFLYSGFKIANIESENNNSIISAYNSDSILLMSDLLKLKWTVPYNTKSGYPYLQDGFLFPTYSPAYAIDAKNGKRLYYKPTKNVRLFRKNSRDSIFAFRNYNRVFVIDTYKGKTLYKTFRKCMYPVRTKPQAIKDSIFCFATNDSTLVAYNLKTDSVLWNFTSKPYIYEYIIKFNDNIWVSAENYLYALSRKDASTLWKIKLGRFFSDPVVRGNKMYVMIKDKGVVCFNLETRKTEWVFTDIDNLPYQSVKLLSDTANIYFMSGELYSINKETGKLNWKNSKISTPYSTSLVFCKDYIITYTEDELLTNYALACNKENGNIIFNMPEKAKNRTNMAFQDNIFSFADGVYENNLYAFGSDSIYCFEILK